ncbi:MAG: sulfurtransferase TusA family protein [Anaerolineales bacterium]|nr:sulfurtransferase TusA family protein [Anaerolineales bacterium]
MNETNVASNVVDARGLSCPEPAMLARQALLEAGQGIVIVLVDSVTSRDNVIRAGKLAGWQSAIEQQTNGIYRLTLTK